MLWIALLGTLATVVSAAGCWRNTTCSGPSEASFTGPWDSNNYSPKSRIIQPQAVLSFPEGEHISSYDDGTTSTLSQTTSTLVFDYGIEVGGIVSFNYQLNGSSELSIGLAFTEARDYIGPESDSSKAGSGGAPSDGPLLVNITSDDDYFVMSDKTLRGGFRYLTIFLSSDATDAQVDITNISLEIGFQPTWSNLTAYGGYFHSDDDLLNKIWYSGAYTVQTNSAPGSTGRNTVNDAQPGWENDAYITDGPTVLLDGAKRDRWVWIGDMGIAVPSAFVSTGDLESTKYALLAIYDNQRADGMFPKSGPPYVRWDSDTYHLWTLIGTYNYFLYSGDVDLIEELWPKYQAAVNYSTSLLTSDGIVSVEGEKDWGRLTYGKERSSASMLLYRVLTTAAEMVPWIPGLSSASIESISTDYRDQAENLRDSIVDQFWDDDVGAFTENPQNSTLYPQDANSMGLAYGVISSEDDRASRISDFLASTWTDIGPSSPELPNNVSPFISSIELNAHIHANRTDRALELTRTLWGWYLNHENGTQSTTPEGFLTNGTWGYRYNQGYANGPAYTSHAHCWSSGPTTTLTEHIVGLRVLEPAGQSWIVQPATFTELTSAEAGFTTKLGKFSAKFVVDGCDVTISWNTPDGTNGTVSLPGQEVFQVEGGQGESTITLDNECS